MTNTIFVSPGAARSALSCVWIETGNPAQPLVCVWVDREMRIADHDDQPQDQPFYTLDTNASMNR